MDGISRRSLIQGSLVLAGALATSGAAPVRQSGSGRLRQSVSRWPFESIPLPEFCRAAKDMGLAAIDLLGPADWDLVHDHGLVCSMGYPTDRNDFIATGFNRIEHHAMLLAELERTIPLARQHGVPNVIAMFGNRNGLSDDEGAEHCIAGLSKIKGLAEQEGVTVCVELLNSKVDHHDYQGDHTEWGVRVMQGVNSPRVKLLYDIYHLQIMEGDIIRTIRDTQQYIGHYHTGGVPGRHELDDTQELNYRAIASAIADTGFTGFVAHEFMPTRDPLRSLREAVQVCTV
jgi:hydroxypyruvate isomerase